jgi:hypothetical protein
MPSNDEEHIHIDRQTDAEGSTKYAVEMGSVAMIYLPSKVHEDCFSHSKIDGYTCRRIDSKVISLASFHFSN